MDSIKFFVTMEESFLNKGSLDSIVGNLCFSNRLFVGMTKLGFGDKYVFEVGNREHLYKVNKLDHERIIKTIKTDLNRAC